MLPRKRAAGTQVEDAAEEALLKKAKAVGCAISSSSSSFSSSSVVRPSSSSAAAGASSEKEKHVMSNGVENGSGPVDIDEDLHSRQLAVYGRETMRRLFASNVLISGLQGLGAEIAKNLVLAGIKSLTLHDEGNVELWDLSGNFFLSEEDVGKNRALACVQKLQELNNAVAIYTLTGALTKEQLSDFQVWAGPLSGDRNVVVLWNRCSEHVTITAKWEMIGLDTSTSLSVRDLWKHEYLAQNVEGSIRAEVDPHDCRMYILEPTNSYSAS